MTWGETKIGSIELAGVRVIGSRLYCCYFSRVRINILKQLWCYNLLQSCYRQDVAKMIFSLFSRNKNLAKLRVHFKVQVGNLWTKLTETWPTYDQIVIRKTLSANFDFFYRFLVKVIFPQAMLMTCYPVICLLQKNKHTCQKIWAPFFSQTRQEVNTILICF